MRTFLALFFLAIAFAADARAQSESAVTRVADGFDFPVGKRDALGYHKARGFQPNGHLGEDWNGNGGGDSDMGDPVCAIGNGIVVFSRDVHLGWGNVVIVRHAFYENGQMHCIDSLYGHLNNVLVSEGQAVSRGERIGAIGTAHGMYYAHLHFEIRKNLAIGMNRAAFARDFSSYYDPSEFIRTHRTLDAAPSPTALVAMNTFSTQPQNYTAPDDETVLSASNSTRVRQTRTTATVARRTPFKVDRFSDLRAAEWKF
jgi:murein DD-endopeptidase MepM/ murein hydrolase activator NlpD